MAIVCAFDFSPYSIEALTAGAALARATNSELRVLHVHDKLGAEFEDVGARSALLEALRAEVRRVGADPKSARVVAGATVHSILMHSRRDVRLLVVGAHGAGRAPTLGSVAAEIATKASIPVLIVRNAVPLCEAADRRAELLVDVAFGNDASSAGALHWAKAFADVVPSVVRPVRASLVGAETSAHFAWDRGPLAEEVAVRAARDRAGLIVVGRSERRGLARLRRPAVRSVLDHATTNVICVPVSFVPLHAAL